MAVEIKTISRHTKTRQGSPSVKGEILDRKNNPKDCGGSTIGATTLGHAQYVIIYGKGSNRKSETKHCSEDAIQAYKKQLEKAGY